MTDLSVCIGSLKLKNPILTASGTFGYGTEYERYCDIGLLGGIITKTITLHEREGNPMPRTAETPCGMLNSIGLANVGIDQFISNKLPELEKRDTAVIVNIAGNTCEEYAEVAARLAGHARVDAIEVNISCPNVKQGGLAFGTDPDITKEIVRAVKKSTAKPVIVKLTPNVTHICRIAEAAVEGGADALSLINTVLGMAVDIHERRPKLARIIGGLSGPAIKPIALAKVFEVVRHVSVPVIGIGGIASSEDTLEFLITGATAVEIGTWTFVHPDGCMRILQGLTEYCEKSGIKRIQEIIGTLRTE